MHDGCESVHGERSNALSLVASPYARVTSRTVLVRLFPRGSIPRLMMSLCALQVYVYDLAPVYHTWTIHWAGHQGINSGQMQVATGWS